MFWVEPGVSSSPHLVIQVSRDPDAAPAGWPGRRAGVAWAGRAKATLLEKVKTQREPGLMPSSNGMLKWGR